MSFNRVRFAALLVASVGLTGCASSSSGDSWTKSAYCPWNWNPFSSSAAKTDATPTAVASSDKSKTPTKPSSIATPGMSSPSSTSIASNTVPATGYQTSVANGPMPNFNAGMNSYPQYGSSTQSGGAYPTTNYPTTQYPPTQNPGGAQPNAYQLAANGQQNTVSNPFTSSTTGNASAGGYNAQPGAVTPVANYGAPNNYGSTAQYNAAPVSGFGGAPSPQLPAYQAPTGGFQGGAYPNNSYQNNVPVTPIPGVQGSAPQQPSQPVYVPQQQQAPANPAGTAGLTPNTLQDIASLSPNANLSGNVPMIPSENKAFNPGQTGFTPPNTVTTNSLSNNAFRPGGTSSFPATNGVATVSYDNQAAGNVATANYNQSPGVSNQNATAGMNCANGVCTPAQKTDWTGGATITPPASFNTPFQNAANTPSPGTPIYRQ